MEAMYTPRTSDITHEYLHHKIYDNLNNQASSLNAAYAQMQAQHQQQSGALQNALGQNKAAWAQAQNAASNIYSTLITQQPIRNAKIGINKPKPKERAIIITRTKYTLGTMGIFEPFRNFLCDMLRIVYAS